MNERILELAQNAGLISHFNAAPHRPDIEKFAELIIRECIEVCAKNKTAFQNESLSAQSQVSRDAWRDKRDGAGECVFSIKEHFGVE